MLGEELWVSEVLEGVASGSPVASNDGQYIFLTHNSGGGTEGHFTVLNATLGDVFFTQRNQEAPFAPVGIHHQPAEGYYDGGEGNTNDILVWSVQPRPSDTVVGDGMTFAFQFPLEFVGNSNDGLTYTILSFQGLEVRDFQTIQKPVFANEGRSLYWGTSRSQFRCWAGEEGNNRLRFSRARTSAAGFTRGSPAGQAVYAPLALSNDETNLSLFGGSAAREFVRLNGSNCADNIMIATTSVVHAQAHVSPDDAFVYYVEFAGILHQASTSDLMDSWIFNIGAVEGGSALAMKEDGTVIYVADVAGTIYAIQVAEPPSMAPSSSPSFTPSEVPSESPTGAPSASVPSSSPSTSLPTVLPTSSPSLEPTSAPTKEPTVSAPDSEEEIDPAVLEERSAGGRTPEWAVGVAFIVPVLVML